MKKNRTFATVKRPRSLMDKMKDSGSLAVGSIPAEGTKSLTPPYCCFYRVVSNAIREPRHKSLFFKLFVIASWCAPR